MELLSWIGIIVSVLSLVSRITQLIIALLHSDRSKQFVQVQGEVKILFRLARPVSALIKTLRFGLSYWFHKRWNKGIIKKYYIYIHIHEGRYYVWLRDYWDLIIEWNNKFRTFQEARESADIILSNSRILYEETDANWVHVIAITMKRLTLESLNEFAKKIRWGLFIEKETKWKEQFISLPKEALPGELLNL